MESYLKLEQENRNKARIVTAILTLLFFIILILPWFTYENPPPGQEGMLVNFGDIAVGEGNENAPKEENNSLVEEEVEKSAETEAVDPEEKKPDTKIAENTAKKTVSNDKKVIQDNSKEKAIALANKKKKEKAESEKARKAAKDKEAKRKAAKKKAALAKAEAQKKAAAEAAQKKADALKDNLKNLLGTGGNGEGVGKTGTPGDQGVKDGDPNASNLEGISSGTGMVSGGLAGRGGSGPGISDNSNKTGTIMIRVCVNSVGKVISAEFTQKGSTSTDQVLKDLAKENARKWKFKSGDLDKQCGTIRYEFKVK